MLETIRNLTQREQILLLGLGFTLALMLLVYGVVQPILSFQRNSVSSFASAARLVELTENLDAGGEGSASDRALRSNVTEFADRRNIVYTRINTSPDQQIQIDLENVPYNAFFTWLNDLDRDERIVVTSAFVSPGDVADTVEARLTLMRLE